MCKNVAFFFKFFEIFKNYLVIEKKMHTGAVKDISTSFPSQSLRLSDTTFFKSIDITPLNAKKS